MERHPAPWISGQMLAILAACALVGAGCAKAPSGDQLAVHKVTTVTTHTTARPSGRTVASGTDTLVLWLGSTAARRDSRDGTFLVDSARDRLLYVDHRERTWTAQSTHEVQHLLAAIAADSLTEPDDDPRLAQLKSMLDVAVKVTDAGEYATVDGYRCRRWLMEQQIGEVVTTSELWLTEDIALDFELLHRATRPALLAIPGGEPALAELAKLRGVPVVTTAIIQRRGLQTRSETRLLSVETVRVPREFFAPPAGYQPASADDLRD